MSATCFFGPANWAASSARTETRAWLGPSKASISFGLQAGSRKRGRAKPNTCAVRSAPVPGRSNLRCIRIQVLPQRPRFFEYRCARGRAHPMEQVKSVWRILITIGVRDITGPVSEWSVAIWQAGIVVDFDILRMTIHHADIAERILIRDVFVAGLTFVPGVTPMDRPFGHQPCARRMFN